MENEISLELWLDSVADDDPGVINFSFPSNRLRDDYIASLSVRTDDDVLELLHRFLIPSCSLGCDAIILAGWSFLESKGEQVGKSQFRSRLMVYVGAKKQGFEAPPPWEGITWVLDLLPDNPRAAINALEAYFEAHGLLLPDGRIHGLFDAMEVIRAKYILNPRSYKDAIRLLQGESPRVFEHLVERLYCTHTTRTA
ncbi:hypothetical protein [Bradyrhizobium sp. USDA 3364]